VFRNVAVDDSDKRLVAATCLRYALHVDFAKAVYVGHQKGFAKQRLLYASISEPSSMPGTTTSAIKVTNISKHGLGLFTLAGERFLPFNDFPWFRDAPVAHILNVQKPLPDHYRWPDLDVDLSLKIIKKPQDHPLRAQGS
jgi:hypothetical protein